MASRRRKHRMKRHKAPVPARFALGAAVRVRPGTADPDFGDIPLGGWAGTIEEVSRRSRPPTYLVRWNQSTLEQMHPVYRKRCERDGLEFDSMWLAETDLDPDTGAPAPIEQPTQIITRPLRMRNREDRIRAVFGLTSDDTLPPANPATLRHYHAFLTGKLSFPFPARYVVVVSGPRVELTEHRVEVTGLCDPDDADEDDGLLCETQEEGQRCEVPVAWLNVPQRHPNRVPIDDYEFWFTNAPVDDDAADEDYELEWVDTATPPSPARAFVYLLLTFLIGGTLYGAVLGAALGAVEQAGPAAGIGAALLGLIGCLIGLTNRRFAGRTPSTNVARVFGALVGIFGGALLGALAGAALRMLVAAYPGALIGGLVGR